MPSSPEDVTQLIEAVRAGEQGALDAALERLSALDPQLCRLVELRYFGGLTIRETAEGLRVSPKTVEREWDTAKLWLRREISRSGLT